MPKIPVAILGATGSVGQKFIERLIHHPWFEITALAASDRSAGKRYRDAVNWFQQTPLPPSIGEMVIHPCKPHLEGKIVFSGLDSRVAGEIETAFAQAGYLVISNSRNHRLDADVPLLLPEVNPDHLAVLDQQQTPGKIVTNSNCSTMGLVMALKPLHDQFGVKAVHVVTLQALSGAGYPGVASLDILDNVIPYIGGEEDKIETEPLKMLGHLQNGSIQPAHIQISAACNRVAVVDGHLECVSIQLKTAATKAQLIEAWTTFRGLPQELELPSAPRQPLHYFHEDKYPQPKLHRQIEDGMAVSIGRLRECPVLDWKFVVLSHNTVRGAAGCAILNAELIIKTRRDSVGLSIPG
ncbi:MAG: aspartate-semialdehyde dehydrogenase [Gemmatimonadetes bacterium]|nr:MAG: aspartate-semialdehyde dehydrogenase [Gemmatimonadota bacterium]